MERSHALGTLSFALRELKALLIEVLTGREPADPALLVAWWQVIRKDVRVDEYRYGIGEGRGTILR